MILSALVEYKPPIFRNFRYILYQYCHKSYSYVYKD